MESIEDHGVIVRARGLGEMIEGLGGSLGDLWGTIGRPLGDHRGTIWALMGQFGLDVI